MSRIGKKPIIIPEGVTVTLNSLSSGEKEVKVKGSGGELTHIVPSSIQVEVSDGQIVCSLSSPTDLASQWGLHRTLIANLVVGVSEGFTKELELEGLGYRVKKSGDDLVFNLGLSHQIPFPAPSGVTFEVTGDTKIKVTGMVKQAVNAAAASIRDLKKPEPYKGKGIKYVGEVIRRKAGKAGKVGAGTF